LKSNAYTGGIAGPLGIAAAASVEGKSGEKMSIILVKERNESVLSENRGVDNICSGRSLAYAGIMDDRYNCRPKVARYI
jgi:hypothetical protein